MLTTILFCNKNNKSDKLSINNGNFSDNYFGNKNNKIANGNDTKIFSASSNNNFPDFSIINQCKKVIYILDITYKARFASLANVFIA